jgi:copper chaperone CopZ
MTQITLSIPEIHCMSCEMLIKLSLNKLPGITTSSTDLKTKKVTIDFDDSVISKTKIIEQIVKDT